MREENYEPALEHEVESRFAVSNGVLGVRASLEHPTRASRPRSYVAGLFGPGPDGTAGRALIPGPDWSRIELALDAEPVTLEGGETLAHSRTLDLRRGLLITDWRQRQASGRVVQLRTLRLASLAERSLGLQMAEIRVEQPASVTLQAGVEPAAGDIARVRDHAGVSLWRTEDPQRGLALAMDCQLRVGQRAHSSGAAEGLCRRWHWDAKPREPAAFAKIVAVARDGSKARNLEKEAAASLRRALRAGPERLVGEHAAAWEERWTNSDVVIHGDADAQQALRFALYHLISAANPEDEHTSIGARALTGDAYLGHVFWDTDIFILPFYTLTWPAAARALLMYRYYTLAAARAKAARLGCRGALYAWESADSGEETTPRLRTREDGRVVPIRSGTDEQHISADVAYAVWQYWNATGDNEFLLNAGAEVLLETARFWASRATLEPDGRYHIRGVIGPDEYHEGVDDNAYTNVMAQWNLERGQEIARLLRLRWPRRWAALQRRLRIGTAELAHWEDVAARLAVVPDPATGLLEQFAGFFQLQPVDLSAYEPRGAPMDVLLGPERIQQSQVIKQADVIMLLALLWERFPAQARETNFRYYEPRCGHGSSLSPPVHALVAAKLGDTALALRYFRETAAIDLDDTMGNAAGGVHIGALGGLWQAAIFGFAGLTLGQDGIAFDPHLPAEWDEFSFPLRWRGRSLRVGIRCEPLTVEVTLASGKALTLRIGARQHRLLHGETWACRSAPDGAGWREV
jgi:trehalose/maltose hydrolase-like predicted phosphorylase